MCSVRLLDAVSTRGIAADSMADILLNRYEASPRAGDPEELVNIMYTMGNMFAGGSHEYILSCFS